MSARVSKFAYGVEAYQTYNDFNSDHKRRKNKTFMTPEGRLGIDGIFNVILPQVRDAQRLTALILIKFLCLENQGLRDSGI